MRVIIAGSRTITDYSIIEKAVLLSGFDITTVISGTARGVDQLGEEYAQCHNIPIEQYFANWDLYGKSAGYKRNELMATKADGAIVIIKDHSKGSTHMVNIMKAAKKLCFSLEI
jgi:hypothetical protein